MIPGIIAILLTIITMLLTGLAIVKERETGTLEQLLVTPLKPWQIIAGKTIPFAMLGIAEMALATTVGVLWFGIPIAGNVALLALLALTFILATLGLGVLISTLAGTQQQALFITWFFLQIFILLSGLFYPIENMPRAVQTITVDQSAALLRRDQPGDLPQGRRARRPLARAAVAPRHRRLRVRIRDAEVPQEGGLSQSPRHMECGTPH